MSTYPRADTDDSLFRIPPHHYLHVLDQNTNVSRLVIGPKTFMCKDHERVVLGPVEMIKVPPRHYCVISNPVICDKDGKVLCDDAGQVKIAHADLDFRMAQDPFPLYPGEILKQKVTPLKVIWNNTALRLRAVLDFEDESGNKRVAGDEWLFEGPGTYIPRKEVEDVETIKATVIGPNQAIRLCAIRDCVDRDGTARVTGEEWLVKSTGAYIPGTYEKVVDVIDALVLTEKEAIHLRALRTFKDDFGVNRKNGDEWLIKMSDTEAHIPNVYEEVEDIVQIQTLDTRSYCVILDPYDDSTNEQRLGSKKLVRGPKNFFLRPGERLERGIQPVYVLGENEGLILRAREYFKDGETEHSAGEKWMIRGPVEYVPPVEVDVVTKRKAIPLEKTEGIYVKNVKTGVIRDISGQTYMLNEDEELWEKELPPEVEALLLVDHDPVADRHLKIIKPCKVTTVYQSDKDPDRQGRDAHLLVMDQRQNQSHSLGAPPIPTGKVRDKTKMVTLRVPHNAAVQIYKYKDKKARVVFGPELVMLGHDEDFTQLSLSGRRPKRNHQIRSLCLLLGPEFFGDIITVETADHARLQLELSYTWHFEIKNKKDPVEAARLFSVPDFVGDACKAIASRIRGAVATVTFDVFHKNSASLIQGSVFGFDKERKMNDVFRFPQNNLVITSIDIQSVEPVDQRTRDSLMKSVQMAIEITTNSQEAAARHSADRLEQEAKGRIERQQIKDAAEAECQRRELLELEAYNAAIESTGQAKAEAQSRAEARRIEGQGEVTQAISMAEAQKITAEAELENTKKSREAELKYQEEQNRMEILKEKQLAAIETANFTKMVDALGPETLKEIATAGPNNQLKMLEGLGLSSTLITDGSSPINLFNTAQGLIGGTTAS